MLSQLLPRQNPEPILSLKQKAGRVLAGHGFQEIITYSLTSLEMLNKLLPETHPLEPMPLRMANPMTTDREYLRPNLRANLLAAFSANRRYEDGGIRLFELGKVYLPRHNDLPDEPEVLCGILGGSRFGESWQGKNELLDFYDVKGVVEGLLNHLSVTANFEEDRDEGLCLGKQAAIVVDGKNLGVVGELNPKVLVAFEISEPVYLFEINLTALLPCTIGHKMFQPIPRFPAIVRDMALVVDAGITHQRVLALITSFPLVNQVTLFDVYVGDQVPRGKKSLAYRIIFQSSTHTLTDEEVYQVQQQILDKLYSELGATLRS
jgi:phenylalanyl-tRNA synthetase beta chain